MTEQHTNTALTDDRKHLISAKKKKKVHLLLTLKSKIHFSKFIKAFHRRVENYYSNHSSVLSKKYNRAVLNTTKQLQIASFLFLWPYVHGL